MGLFKRIRRLFTPLTEQEKRDRRRDKLLDVAEHRLGYRGIECVWEEFEERGGGSRTRRVTKLILVD